MAQIEEASLRHTFQALKESAISRFQKEVTLTRDVSQFLADATDQSLPLLRQWCERYLLRLQQSEPSLEAQTDDTDTLNLLLRDLDTILQELAYVRGVQQRASQFIAPKRSAAAAHAAPLDVHAGMPALLETWQRQIFDVAQAHVQAAKTVRLLSAEEIGSLHNRMNGLQRELHASATRCQQQQLEVDLLTEKTNELEHHSRLANETLIEQTGRWRQQTGELEEAVKYWREQHESSCIVRTQLEFTLAEKVALSDTVLAECQVLRSSNQKLHDSVESWKVLHEGMLQDLQVANKAMQDSPIKLQAEKEVAMSLERRLEEMGHSHKKEREELIQALREETNALREQQLSNTHLRQALNEEQEQACALRSELQQVNRGLLDLQAQLSESDRLQSQLDAADASLASTKQRLEAAERCRGEDLQLHELELKKLQGERFRDIFVKQLCIAATRRTRQTVLRLAGAFGRDKAELEGLWERRLQIVSTQLEAEVWVFSSCRVAFAFCRSQRASKIRTAEPP
jgi:hypothetical protein